MNNERNYDLDRIPNWLRERASDLDTQIRELETREGSPTETNYDEILYLTMSVITIAIGMAEALQKIAEDADLQAPDTIVGAAGKANLGYSHIEKDRVARIALESARAILNSHNRLTSALAQDIADICYKIIKEKK